MSEDQKEVSEVCKENVRTTEGPHCLHHETEIVKSGQVWGFDRCCWCNRVFNGRYEFTPEHGPHKKAAPYNVAGLSGKFP